MNDNFSKLILTNDNLPMVEQMAENIPGGFFIYKDTEKAEIIYVNKAVLELYGCDNLEEFKLHTGYSFNGMVHPEDYVKIQSAIDFQIDRSETNTDYVEYRIIRKDGSVRYVEDFGHFSQTEDFGNIYYVFITDVTDKYKLGIAQNAFLFNAAHDVKTPLTEIGSYIKQLKESIGGKMPDAQYASRIEESCLYATGIIDELVEASEINIAHPEPQEVICNLDEEGAKLQSMAQAKEVVKEQNFYFDLPSVLVYMDPELFERILGNIIQNSIKFTPVGGSIDVTGKMIQKTESGYGRFEFSITDNGIGMSETYLQRVFSVFDQGDPDAEVEYMGAGVGLALVEKAVCAMGGSITATSAPGQGTTITVYLPLRLYEDYKAPQIAENGDPEGCKGHILVAQAVDADREKLESILTKEGYTVDAVSDGCDAFDLFKCHKPNYYDLVFTGVKMPVMTGYELLRRMRRLNRVDAKTTPVYGISSHNQKEDRLRMAESGANGHVSKPVEVDKIKEILETLSV